MFDTVESIQNHQGLYEAEAIYRRTYYRKSLIIQNQNSIINI